MFVFLRQNLAPGGRRAASNRRGSAGRLPNAATLALCRMAASPPKPTRKSDTAASRVEWALCVSCVGVSVSVGLYTDRSGVFLSTMQMVRCVRSTDTRPCASRSLLMAHLLQHQAPIAPVRGDAGPAASIHEPTCH
jgi:hypothetical protein